MAGNKSGEGWRPLLLVIGFAAIAAAIVLELVLLFNDYKKEVVTSADKLKVVTTTHGAAPSAGLVTGVFGVGVACILVAALWDRITKISVAGVDIDLAAKVAEATKEKTKDRPEKFKEVFENAWQELLDRGLGVMFSSYGVGPSAVARPQARARRVEVDEDLGGRGTRARAPDEIDDIVQQAVESGAEKAGLN